MKAAMLDGVNQLNYREIETPTCPPEGLLIKVMACGLCGSDIRKIRHGSHHFKYPVLLGHEVTGEVIESNTELFAVGERLALGSIISCGECTNCMKGIDNLCENAIYHSLGQHDPDYQGGYAEYIALKKEMVEKGPVVRIPDGVSYAEAALVEPYTDVLNSHDLIDINEGEVAVIVGAGPIGAMHVDLLNAKGVDCILADISEARLKLAAKACKPKYLIDSAKDDLKTKVMEFTDGRGADIVVIACSVPSLQSLSPELASFGGRIILFGGLNEADKMLAMDHGLIHYKQMAVFGTMGSCKRHFTKIMAMLEKKIFNTEAYITEMPMEKINEAIGLCEKGDVLKVVLIP